MRQSNRSERAHHLLTKDQTYDSEGKRIVRAYRVVIQLVGRRRPIMPSLMYPAHVISKRWNQEFAAYG